MTKRTRDLPIHTNPPSFGRRRAPAQGTELDAIFAAREQELKSGKKQQASNLRELNNNANAARKQREAETSGESKFEPYDRAMQVRCWAGGASIMAQPTARSGNPTDATVSIELAPKEDPSKAADWSDKIVFQLKSDELTEFAALLLGLTSELEFKRAATKESGSKSVAITRQSGHIYFSARENPGLKMTIAVPALDVFRLSTLVLNQLQKSSGSADQHGMIAALRGAYALNS